MTVIRTLQFAVALSLALPTFASLPTQQGTATPAVTYVVTIPTLQPSATDASFNAWIHPYRSDESTNRTGGAKGVDDVLRLLWQRTRDHGAALDSEAIRQVCEEIAGGSFADCFARYVYGTDKISFEDYFALAGNRLVVDEQPTRVRDSTGFLGIGTQVQEDGVRVLRGCSAPPTARRRRRDPSVTGRPRKDSQRSPRGPRLALVSPRGSGTA